MILQSSSDLIVSHEPVLLRSGEPAHEAELINGKILLISSNALALYQKKGDFLDPLGNGCIRTIALPPESHLSQSPFLLEHRAGYVGLSNGGVFLIGLNDIRLYTNSEDALKGQNELARMSLAG